MVHFDKRRSVYLWSISTIGVQYIYGPFRQKASYLQIHVTIPTPITMISKYRTLWVIGPTRFDYPFPKQQILDSSKLKEFTDDNFKFDENGRKLYERVKNTLGKG